MVNKTVKLAISTAFAAVAGFAVAPAFAHNSGYLIDSNGEIVRNAYGECWKTGYWTPAMAVPECGGEVEKPKVEEAKADAPMQPAGPDKPAFEKVTLQAETLFDFDKSVVRPDGKKILDDLVAKMKQYKNVDLLLVTGHADRIGPEAYNMKLSKRRADAVKAYLVKQGIEPNRIEAQGKGETEPVVECKGVRGKALIKCLQPNRRVVVEIKMQRPN